MPHHLTLKITLRDTKPPIWRRVTVPIDYSFADLHQVIQIAMGWEDYHLWQFWDGVRGPQSLMLGPIPPGETAATWFDLDDQRDASTVLIGERLKTVGQKWLYTYDMGDNWEHQLLLEAIEEVPAGALAPPNCLAGKGACPPEDCGGIPGFDDLLDALQAGGKLPEWLEGHEGFDPKAFDRAAVNAELATLPVG